MRRNKFLFFLFISGLFWTIGAFAQAPVISYPTHPVYTVNAAINNLVPANSGGAVGGGLNTVETFAGDGLGNPTTFYRPTGIALDNVGNVYVADPGNSLIRNITPAGQVSTFAGSGQPAFANGTGTDASFNQPFGLVMDPAGNMFVTDLSNHRIRKITPQGQVTVFAGSGTAGAVNANGLSASFNEPAGIAIDQSDNLYVTELGNNDIRKITPAGDVSTLAGSGVVGNQNGKGVLASFNGPSGVAVDAAGNIFVADSYNNQIKKITPDGTVTTFAGGATYGNANGVGTAATFHDPIGLVFDAQGNLYVGDTQNSAIRKIAPDGTVTTLGGSPANRGKVDGSLAVASFNLPYGVAIAADGSLYVADSDNLVIRKIVAEWYSINDVLPPGLIFDPNTGIISGTPAVVWPATNYFITAHNSFGTSSAVVTIEVDPEDDSGGTVVAAPDISYPTPQNYIVGRTIATLHPTNTGGPVPATAYGQPVVFAGSGVKGNVNATGAAASFNNPTDVATDDSGNIYVSDRDNFLIRKITPDGVVTTFAGSGTAAVVDGRGTAASFKGPEGIATDAAGNVYVADTYGNVIRKISPDGQVVTIAGTGATGDTNGPMATATFNQPQGIAVDANGNIYVSEFGSCLIRKISAAGIVSIFAGNGSCNYLEGRGSEASFNNPEKLAVDANGNVYVADFGNSRVRKITPQGDVTTVLRRNNQNNFQGVGGVAVDRLGNIYMSDSGNGNIIKLEAVTNQVSFFTLGNSLLQFPLGMSVDANGSLYVANFGSSNIVKVPTTGYTIDKVLPAGLIFDPATGQISGTPTQAYQITPFTITAYNAGGHSSFIITITVQLTNQANNPPVISYQSPQTYYVNQTIAPLSPTSSGSDIPPFQFGQAITFSGAGNAGHADGGPTAASFTQPAGVATDASGNVYVADYLNNLIRKVSADGSVVTMAGSGQGTFADGTGADASFSKPGSVVLDAAGNLYVADSFNHRIRKITPDGVVTTFAGSSTVGAANGNGTAASFNNPSGLAIDLAGNIYVADSGNNLIRKISVDGDVTTLAGSGFPGSANGNGSAASFNAPQNLTVDVDGNVYVTDSGNNLIRKITSSGDVTTYAGNGSAGGDNGPALSASFNKPYGIVVDDIGDLFVSDFGGNVIRMIDPAGNVITLAGDGLPGGLNNTGTAASFHSPKGLALDANRKLYVADSGNNEIRTLYTVGYRIDKPLPPGLEFDNATGVISGKPGQTSPLTTYTITAYNIYGSATATVDIQILNTQSITFAPIADKTVCAADFDPGATSDSPVTYTSSDPAVATIVAGKVHVTGAGTTTITAADGNSTYPQTLIVHAAVTPSVSITPVDTHDCGGSAVSFTAVAVNGGDTPHYQWKINGENAGTDESHFLTNSLNDNDKVTCVLTSSEACTTNATAVSNEVTFKLDPPVTLSVTISTPISGPVCAGTNMVFTALVPSADATLKYNWQVNGFDIGAHDATFSSVNLNDGDVVTCVITSTGRCVVTPSVTSNAIAVKLNPVSQCKIIIPNTFTPNGDGINDLWNITALLYYPDCSVTVFSRYGSVVYRSNGYAKPWDGTSGNSTLPTGVYYYVIDLKNGQKPMAGPVTLVR